MNYNPPSWQNRYKKLQVTEAQWDQESVVVEEALQYKMKQSKNLPGKPDELLQARL